MIVLLGMATSMIKLAEEANMIANEQIFITRKPIEMALPTVHFKQAHVAGSGPLACHTNQNHSSYRTRATAWAICVGRE